MSAPSSIAARVSARARAARPPPALAGGDGASTLMSHLGAEHSHGRGLLGFLTHEGAMRTLSGVCRELRREVGSFRWPVVVLRGHTAEVRSVCALADGRVVSASWDKTLRVWNTATGACESVLAGQIGYVYGVCALDDGRVVSASHDKTLRVWSVATGACERELRGNLNAARCVCSLAGRIVSASEDTTLRVWDAASGVCERVLHGHTGNVYSVCALPSGHGAVSASQDHTLRVWNIATGACDRVLAGHT